MNLENKVAVISGGAGQVGHATAIRLAQQGVRIFSLVRRNLDRAQALVDALPNSYLQHQVLLADVKDAGQIKIAAAKVKEIAGRCDILVNSAGIALHPHNVLEFPDEQFDETIDVNLKGPWYMMREFYPMLKESGDGLIVNISSMASVRPRPNSAFYSAVKAGLNAMTDSLAKAFGPEVRVVAVAPSMLEGPVSGWPFMPEKKGNAFPIETARNMNSLKRICTADDVAGVIESLATHIKFYNGHLIILDGGV